MADFYYELAALLFDNPDYRRAAVAFLEDEEAQKRADAIQETIQGFLDELEEDFDDLAAKECEPGCCPDGECVLEDEDLGSLGDDDVTDEEVLAADEGFWQVQAPSSDVWQL